MKFRIRTLLGDEAERGFTPDPGYDVTVEHPVDLQREAHFTDGLCGDYGDPLPVGAQLIIERIA